MEDKYYHTTDTVNEYIRLAEGYNGRKLIEKLKPYLSSGSSVLELGSGPGTDWKILNQSYSIIGSDNSLAFINFLNDKYPQGKFLELDAITLNTQIKFDTIYSNKVLHHLKDNELKKSVERQHEILNTNGIICHSFWKGEGTEIFKGLFVNYHNRSELNKTFEHFFEILLLEEYKEFEDDDSILLIAKKK